MEVPQGLKIETLHDPAIQILRVYSKEIQSMKRIVEIAVLLCLYHTVYIIMKQPVLQVMNRQGKCHIHIKCNIIIP